VSSGPAQAGSIPVRLRCIHVKEERAYAPDLNPVEGLWSSHKAVELANLTSPTLAG